MSDAQDFRIRLVFWRCGMDFQRSKLPGKGNMLLATYVLITKKDDFILKQRRADLCNQIIIESAQVNIEKFRADGR